MVLKLLLPYKFHGSGKCAIYYFNFDSCDPLITSIIYSNATYYLFTLYSLLQSAILELYAGTVKRHNSIGSKHTTKSHWDDDLFGSNVLDKRLTSSLYQRKLDVNQTQG